MGKGKRLNLARNIKGELFKVRDIQFNGHCDCNYEIIDNRKLRYYVRIVDKTITYKNLDEINLDSMHFYIVETFNGDVCLSRALKSFQYNGNIPLLVVTDTDYDLEIESTYTIRYILDTHIIINQLLDII